MNQYIILDVSKYDGMTYEEALRLAEHTDAINANFQQYLIKRMAEIGELASANTVLQSNIELKNIEKPAFSNVELLTMHRKRTQLVICNNYHNCLMYLMMKGQFHMVFDKSLISPEDYPNILHSHVIEPYQVIEADKKIGRKM